MSQMTISQALQKAVEHHQAGQFPEAEALYRQVLGAKPQQPDALHLLGLLGTQIGQVDAGIELMRQAVVVKPDFPGAWSNLGAALLRAHRADEAIACCERALALQSNLPDTHYIFANALREKRRFEEAVASYRQALALNPDHPDASRALAVLLREIGRFDESLAVAQAAVELKPDYAAGFNEIGTTFDAQGKFDEAIAAYQKALDIQDDFLPARSNLGMTLARSGHLDEAIASFRQTLRLREDLPELHINLAQALLMKGDLAEGFRELEWRWKLPTLAPLASRYPRPRWEGTNPNGRIILLSPEPNWSDMIQFVRYAPLLSRQGATVVVMCQPELRNLLTGMENVDKIMTENEDAGLFELQCPIGSLPLAFGTTLDQIPHEVPYIKPDVQASRYWARRLAHERNLKVGLMWAEDPARTANGVRSVPFSLLAPLLHVPKVSFYPLQAGAVVREYLPESASFIDWTQELSNISDVAALMANLDLIISVDSVAVHLAGALGRPVWTLLHHTPEWRWMLERTDSPWYPTMKLFRQRVFGDWTVVIQQVAAALTERAATAASAQGSS